jgi:hypothetical protein
VHVDLVETEPGSFEADFVVAELGVYPVHVRAWGTTLRGAPFTREQLLTAAAVRGGDAPPRTSDPSGRDELCKLIECLLSDGSLERFMAERGLDPGAVLKCVKAWCARPGSLSIAALEEVRLRAASSEGGQSRLEETLMRIVSASLASRPDQLADVRPSRPTRTSRVKARSE